MNSESYFLPRESAARQWLKTSRKFYNKEEKKEHFVFICDVDSCNYVNLSKKHHITLGFAEARQKICSLNSSSADNHSKIIFIDTPLVIPELEKFSSFLKKRTNCVVIYNQKKLTDNEAKFLKAFELIDEVADLQQDNLDWVIENAVKVKVESKQKSLYQNTKKLGIMSREKARDFSFLLKKVFDISVAAVMIFMLLPVFILIILAIKLDSEGPVFYSSLRAGRGYRIFKFYKFRSMIKDADKKMKELAHLNQYSISDDGPAFFKINDDPRITRVGRFLRNTSLDELPQLFNILFGNMSLVGNRPLPLYEAATLTTNDFVERFSAPAGMTGFWQIKKRGKAEMSVKERVDLDITYARKASPFFDLYIIASTPAALFQKSDV